MPSEHEKRLYHNQMGLTGTVHREKNHGDLAKQINQKLAEIGLLLQQQKFEHYSYWGSAAVHVFRNETMKHTGFVSQADGLIVNGCTELVAQSATTDLVGTILEKYGHKRPTKRSGF